MTPSTWLAAVASRPLEEWYAYDRLALADWLEECDDPRAAQVRVPTGVEVAVQRIIDRGSTDQDMLDDDRELLTAGLGWLHGDVAAERFRLLSLFPDVTITAPCPWCPENALPAFVTVELNWREWKPKVKCLACLGNGDRTATATQWIPSGRFEVARWKAVRYRINKRPLYEVTVRNGSSGPVVIPTNSDGWPAIPHLAPATP